MVGPVRAEKARVTLTHNALTGQVGNGTNLSGYPTNQESATWIAISEPIQAVQEPLVGKSNDAALTYRFQRIFPDVALSQRFLYVLSNSRFAA